MPEYDGRGDKPTTAGDVLLWPPRIVLFPLFLTHEYLIRKPLGALATHAEKHEWPTRVADFFTWGGHPRKGGIVPTMFYEFGFRPSVGAYAFLNDVGFEGHEFRAHAGTWGPNWISTAIVERFRFRDNRAMFSWRAEYIRRPDALFAGIGPRTLERDVSRFGFTRLAFAPSLDINLGGMSSFRATVGIRSLSFRNDDNCCGDPEIREVVARGTYDYPPGFDGYTAIHQTLELALDSRNPVREGYQEQLNGSGVRLSLDVEHAGDIRHTGARQWIRYGGQLGGFLDLDGHGRTLALVVSTTLVDPIGGGEVPFTEQSNLPYAGTVGAGIVGIGPLRGFRPGRLVDRSSLVATLQYSWPIWTFLDGAVHFAAGNVWGPHLRELEPRLIRFSTGIGFRTTGSQDHAFEALIASGTETIADGLRFNTIRIFGGFTRGF